MAPRSVFIAFLAVFTFTPFPGETFPTKEDPVIFENLKDDHRKTLETTLTYIESLSPGQVLLPQKKYLRLSRFRELFGFPFDGKVLKLWLLKRVKKFSYHNGWTIALNQNKGDFLLGDHFFEKSDLLERAYALIHEARHSDDHGYEHVKCPKGYPFVSAGTPHIDLEKVKACDNRNDGSYAFQAAFLFELYARNLKFHKEAGLLYNLSLTRIVHR